ncbi:MAG: hypothetical protein K9N49_02540 [Candidatus Marinimicrobia bacterium]|nr:hypothetical protein [Candidatus Neomarinimicrobiota bacterium]
MISKTLSIVAATLLLCSCRMLSPGGLWAEGITPEQAVQIVIDDLGPYHTPEQIEVFERSVERRGDRVIVIFWRLGQSADEFAVWRELDARTGEIRLRVMDASMREEAFDGWLRVQMRERILIPDEQVVQFMLQDVKTGFDPAIYEAVKGLNFDVERIEDRIIVTLPPEQAPGTIRVRYEFDWLNGDLRDCSVTGRLPDDEAQ